MNAIQRIVPNGMRAETAETVSVAETARVENDLLNRCPICRNTLRLSEANCIPVMVCDDHAIVMPIKD